MFGVYRTYFWIMKTKAKRKYSDPDGWLYYREYDAWISKLNITHDKALSILDIGCDKNQSLRRYLERNGYEIGSYVGYDLLLNMPFKRDNIDEFYKNYNFVKMDCEGCEYQIFEDVSEEKLTELFNHKYIAIALHRGGQFNEKFDGEIYEKVTSILPRKIFVTGNKDMTEVEEIWTRGR